MNSMKSKRGQDRISALPKALTCHILSFLPTLEAVRTTVLSKTWNNMWASVTTLDFDEDRDGFTDRNGLEHFIKFVNRVLFFRDSSDIQKFKLCMLFLPKKNMFEHWICTAVRRNVVELCVCFETAGRRDYPIPTNVFTCKALRALRLKLHRSYLPDDYPPPGCFKNLKFLHVTFQYCTPYCLPEKLFSCCPVVEDLIIDGEARSMSYVFNIRAPQLKSLTVCLDDFDIYEENDFHIDAPNLEKLVLKSVSFSNFNLESVKSLVSASISFDCISASNFPSFSTRATALLAGISNVKYLSLSIHFKVSYLPAAFINLKTLDLLLYERNYWDSLAELLNRAPKLEDIVVEDKTEFDNNEYSELAWNPPEDVPLCLLSQLKTITIKGFKGQRVDMEVAKYLLNKGHVLNELVLHTGFLYTEAEEMYKEFLMFHRAKSCQVKFIKM